jgi:hypothetical protein
MNHQVKKGVFLKKVLQRVGCLVIFQVFIMFVGSAIRSCEALLAETSKDVEISMLDPS